MAIDPDRVPCINCGESGPIEERAQVGISIHGKDLLQDVYICRKCFEQLLAKR
jgi:hypothetical protein